jgi:hypothetical protein
MHRDPDGNWGKNTPRVLLKLSAHGMLASCCPDCLKKEVVDMGKMSEAERQRKEIQALVE